MKKTLVLANRLTETHDLPDEDLLLLLSEYDEETTAYCREQARRLCDERYGKNVFIRGLIEFTNYCKNDCYYCGIRRSNDSAERYRLTKDDILQCCEIGYPLGFRTFVLQGGEDPFFTDDRLCAAVAAIKSRFPDCAVTVSAGERSAESFRRLREAGADRYLLRHETATECHYRMLHPAELQFQNRMRCLDTLMQCGFQTGCGFMVGSPGQTLADIVRDLRFMKQLKPHMIGVGPFLAHSATPFRNMPDGSASLTLFLLSIIRIMLPDVLLPATTALGTALSGGRALGILHGANVIMPNLSPPHVRDKYALYNNKLHSGAEAAEGIRLLKEELAAIGYAIAAVRGDNPQFDGHSINNSDYFH